MTVRRVTSVIIISIAIMCGGLVFYALSAKKILHPVARVSVVGTESFVAEDHIKEANIGWIGDKFSTYFLKRIENSSPADDLTIYRLQKDSPDAPIISELGDCAETHLSYLFELLKKQSKGEPGPLLVGDNSAKSANFIYVRDDQRNLWAVCIYWDPKSHSWDIATYSAQPPGSWEANAQVIACNK